MLKFNLVRNVDTVYFGFPVTLCFYCTLVFLLQHVKQINTIFAHTFVMCSGRIVSIEVVEVILLHDKHITSLLGSQKKNRRKARLQPVGIKCSLWY